LEELSFICDFILFAVSFDFESSIFTGLMLSSIFYLSKSSMGFFVFLDGVFLPKGSRSGR